MVVTVYLQTGIGLAGYNLEILEHVKALLSFLDLPYLILADWNAEPAEILELGLHEYLQADIVTPSGTIAGLGRPLW